MRKKFKLLGGILMLTTFMVASFRIAPIMSVLAIVNNTRLVVQNNSNTISIDATDPQKLNYKIGDIVVGTVKVKIDSNYLTPIVNNNKIEYMLNQYNGTTYQVDVEATASNGYRPQPSYFYQGSSSIFPGDNILHLDITADNIHTLDFAFEANNNSGSDSDPQEPIAVYPIVAYFVGVATPVVMDMEGTIQLPDNWTAGDVTFKAKVCTVGGETAPDDGFIMCDDDSQNEIAVRVEGIANSNQINYSVIGSGDRSHVTINDTFSDYGKVTIHITSVEENGPVNTILNIVTANLINIRADAPLDMSYSLGSSAVDQAIITSDEEKDVSIFFGNTEANLIVSGPSVNKITAVDAGNNAVTLNADGSATVSLPDLSAETITQVRVTILLADNSTVTRTVNIKRTALILEYDDRENELRAGYVMNKGYLYNNQDHSDDIFNAYLQVILYKDNVVAGYKQIKIDDEDVINRLGNDEAWSIETFDDDPIVLYDGSPTGINGASVFLTNGPVSFDNDLPSIEYGIGAGLQVTWEAK